MMKKDQLIKELGKCLLVEDRAIPIYSQHIENTLFLSKFSKEDREKVKKVLNILRADSMRHRNIFQALIEKVKGSDKNVY